MLLSPEPHRANNVYEVPSDVVLEDKRTERWLDLGNWCLYAAPSPTADLLDFHRASPRELVAWLTDNGVEIVVDAFHDNASWVVAISP